MQPVALAFFWHQHQPYYPDDVGGETLMPWVRLHGTKDYLGMALHLKEVPEFRCTINLVPSLLTQLQKYTTGTGSDRHLDISRMPATDLSAADACYVLDNFFMANVDSMIRPYPRYYEFYSKRGLGIDSAEHALSRFSVRELRDLQVWSNLTWIHELAFEADNELRQFRDKGGNWTEKEKSWLLDKQIELLGRVIPLHRELSQSGQVELTTTPFYHPILPLLWDKRSAHQAMPDCPLPEYLDPYPEDAQLHIERAVRFHTEQFGSAPSGMWPSEGSVSQDIVAAIAEAGFNWIATDEEILAESTGGRVSRDGEGHARHPELLYRPWLVESDVAQLQVVFRDHALSDLIGFHYQRGDAAHSASDMISRVTAIGQAVAQADDTRPALVPIILDGENCWEYYPDGGVGFLRTLYRECAANDAIQPLKIGEYLREHPATDPIPDLFAGSWISHNFAIWIGHHEDNTAWDLLHRTREFLKAEAEQHPPDIVERAWEEIYIAEGSDWYWWFGDDHSSAQDELFDQLFRRHLQNVYSLLGAPVPDVLNHPITQTAERVLHTQPTGFLPVKVDGRPTYFEWISAGRYQSGSERGTMTLVTEGLFRDIYLGFDAERLLMRMDTAHSARDDLDVVDELRICFLSPAETELRITGMKQYDPVVRLHRHGRSAAKAAPEVAIGRILELGVPLGDLRVEPGERVEMYVEVFARRQSVERVPHEGALQLTVPSPDFERIMWQV